MKGKNTDYYCFSVLWSFSAGATGNSVINVVPKPAHMKLLHGHFELRQNMEITCPSGNTALQKIAGSLLTVSTRPVAHC